MAKATKQGTIPKHELEALAAVLYPSLKAFYDSPEGQAQFEAWWEQRQAQKPQKPQKAK